MSEWLVRRGNKTIGPVTVDFLREKAASGNLLPTDEIKQPGKTDWVPCSTVHGLFPKSTVTHGTGRRAAAPPPFSKPPTETELESLSSGGFPESEEKNSGYQDGTDDEPVDIPEVKTESPVNSGNLVIHYSNSSTRFLPRLAAFLLDSAILFAILAIPSTLIQIVSVRINPIFGQIMASTILSLISFLVGLIYFSVLESSAKQATFGKRIVGLRVEGINGTELTFAWALGRYLSKCLSYTFFPVLLLPLFTKYRQSMHDLMAQTFVIDDDRGLV